MSAWLLRFFFSLSSRVRKEILEENFVCCGQFPAMFPGYLLDIDRALYAGSLFDVLNRGWLFLGQDSSFLLDLVHWLILVKFLEA